MNKNLLLKVKEKILQEPKQFLMRTWYSSVLSENPETLVLQNGVIKRKVKIPNCGTAACIAGWAACILNKKKPSEASLVILPSEEDFGISISSYYKLTRFQAWPLKFQKHRKEGTVPFAKQAAARIDHFIATEGKE